MKDLITHSTADPKTIVPSPFNKDRSDTKDEPFKEFMESIRQHGIIQPPVVRKLPANQANGKRFELIAGERRWRAALLLQMPEMPIIIREADDALAIELQTIENDKRKDLSPIQKAEKYQQALEAYKADGLTGEKALARLSEKLSKSRSAIYEALNLLKMAPAAKKLVAGGQLPTSHAVLIGKLPETMQGDMALLIAPGLRMDAKVERALEQKLGVQVDYRDEETALVPYRDAKEMVDEALKQHQQSLKYEEKAAEVRKKGGTALTLPEAREKMHDFVASGDWLNEFSMQANDAIKKAGAKAKLPSQILRPDFHDPSKPVMAWPKTALIKALKKAGVKARSYQSAAHGSGSDSEYRKRQAANERRRRQQQETLNKILVELRAAARKRTAKIPWAILLVEAANYDGTRMCKAFGIATTWSNRDKVLAAKLQKTPENQMAGWAAELLIAKFTTESGNEKTGFADLCKFYGVDAAAIRKQAASTRKVQTPGKAKKR